MLASKSHFLGRVATPSAEPGSWLSDLCNHTPFHVQNYSCTLLLSRVLNKRPHIFILQKLLLQVRCWPFVYHFWKSAIFVLVPLSLLFSWLVSNHPCEFPLVSSLHDALHLWLCCLCHVCLLYFPIVFGFYLACHILTPQERLYAWEY